MSIRSSGLVSDRPSLVSSTGLHSTALAAGPSELRIAVMVAVWLDPANGDKELLLATMRPATESDGGGLTSHPVSTAVNSVRNNGPDLIAPLADAAPGPSGPGTGGAEGPTLF